MDTGLNSALVGAKGMITSNNLEFCIKLKAGLDLISEKSLAGSIRLG